MGPLVLGRGVEREAIDRVLGATRDGLSGAFVLRGDAGIGKTTLLDYAASSAPDLRVLRLAGVESESEFGFGALRKIVAETGGCSLAVIELARGLTAEQLAGAGSAAGAPNSVHEVRR